MATTSSKRSSGPVLRSLSPSGRFHTANSYFSSSSSSFASSTSSSFSSPSSAFFNPHEYDHHHQNNHRHHHHSHHRSASPTRVNLSSSPSLTAASFRFSIDRSISPNRSISVSKKNNALSFQKKSCMCSPTTHPGSFRCSLHKNTSGGGNHGHGTVSYAPNRLNMRRSAMTNSLVRIGGVEGEWMKRSLRDLIRPSSHHQKRRDGFQARPSRLSAMSKS
ncbi:hypothetical protein LWI29_011844 [Acer saccharum]|uniref:Serine-rich protein-like protein n=1 Tax=Acer saccharum TaxID=4024 RepID=A0AA39VAX6_ACESA|nr:hypothetical protein LWI29_011844 [Acer saccharum]KAK1551443.1 hypothetical protein Q3G72_035631 [Acer saccharum]